VIFHSNAKEPWNCLSNFYNVQVGNYPSVEHIYQAGKLPEQHRRFLQIDGPLGKFETAARILPNVNVKYWQKKGNVGILAKKYVELLKKGTSPTESAKLLPVSDFKNVDEAYSVFQPWLAEKFQALPADFVNDLVSRVRADPDVQFVEFSRRAKPTSRWSGKLGPDGSVTGQNWMGQIVGRFVKEVLAKR
jgi:hypothetical protein